MLDNSLVGNTTGVNTPEKIMNIINGNTPRILDSGDRTEFSTGAVRDMRAGKGRMDLMPLDVAARLMNDPIFTYISSYMVLEDTRYLYSALLMFKKEAFDDSLETMLLEVGKHFEEGAKKYGENNWQKGIEPKYYIDSAIRHYLKWRRGDKDEPHDRAFVWNIMCCIWEVDWHEKEDEQFEYKSDAQSDKEMKECSTCRYEKIIPHPTWCMNCIEHARWKPKLEKKDIPDSLPIYDCDAPVNVEPYKITKERIEEGLVTAVKEINNETDDALLCSDCKYTGRPAYDYPCNDCYYGDQFEPKEK